MLLCYSYLLMLFKCKNSWNKTYFTADRSANILDCLHAESQVIPSPASAAGLKANLAARQAERPNLGSVWWTFPMRRGGPEERTLNIYLEAAGAP